MKTTKRLFAWNQPALPQDLHLLRESREPWLISIPHERLAVLSLDDDESEALFQDLPAVKDLIRFPPYL